MDFDIYREKYNVWGHWLSSNKADYQNENFNHIKYTLRYRHAGSLLTIYSELRDKIEKKNLIQNIIVGSSLTFPITKQYKIR